MTRVSSILQKHNTERMQSMRGAASYFLLGGVAAAAGEIPSAGMRGVGRQQGALTKSACGHVCMTWQQLQREQYSKCAA